VQNIVYQFIQTCLVKIRKIKISSKLWNIFHDIMNEWDITYQNICYDIKHKKETRRYINQCKIISQQQIDVQNTAKTVNIKLWNLSNNHQKREKFQALRYKTDVMFIAMYWKTDVMFITMYWKWIILAII